MSLLNKLKDWFYGVKIKFGNGKAKLSLWASKMKDDKES